MRLSEVGRHTRNEATSNSSSIKGGPRGKLVVFAWLTSSSTLLLPLLLPLLLLYSLTGI